jgi:hypothetical protein
MRLSVASLACTSRRLQLQRARRPARRRFGAHQTKQHTTFQRDTAQLVSPNARLEMMRSGSAIPRGSASDPRGHMQPEHSHHRLRSGHARDRESRSSCVAPQLGRTMPTPTRDVQWLEHAARAVVSSSDCVECKSALANGDVEISGSVCETGCEAIHSVLGMTSGSVTQSGGSGKKHDGGRSPSLQPIRARLS